MIGWRMNPMIWLEEHWDMTMAILYLIRWRLFLHYKNFKRKCKEYLMYYVRYHNLICKFQNTWINICITYLNQCYPFCTGIWYRKLWWTQNRPHILTLGHQFLQFGVPYILPLRLPFHKKKIFDSKCTNGLFIHAACTQTF